MAARKAYFMIMNILLLFFFLTPFAIGDKLFDPDSIEEAQIDFSNFGSKTNVRELLLKGSASTEDQNDSRPSSEKHRSFSTVFFNRKVSQQDSLTRSSENDDSREHNIIETPKLIDLRLKEFPRFSFRPAVSGRSFSAELKEHQNSNEVSFEVTEVSVVSQISEIKDDSVEITSVLNNGSLLVTTSHEEPDKKSIELFEDQSTKDKNSIETQKFIIREVENGKNFADILKNSRDLDSLQTSNEDSTEVSIGLLRSTPTQTSDENPRRFFVRPLEAGKNFGAELNNKRKQHQNAFSSSDEDSTEATIGLIKNIQIENAKNDANPRKFFVRPREDGKNFGADLNINLNQQQSAFPSSDESLEITTLARNLPNEGTKIIDKPEFFIKPVENARHFSSDPVEKKKNNLFQISVEDDSLEVVGRFSGGQVSETVSATTSPVFNIKPLENGRLFTTELDTKHKLNSEASISTPANFVTSFQQGPTSINNFQDFKKSYPQKAITKFGQTQETFQFSGYPSPKICLEGEVIGLDGRCTFPEIIKNIYIYQKPIKEYVSEELLNPPKPKVKINLVVIRSDGSGNRGDPIIIPPPQEKTVVLVLDKEDENGRKIIEVTPPPSGEPEVYFVDYKEGENPLLPGGIDLQEALGSAILSHSTYEFPQSSNERQQQYQASQQQYKAPQQQYQAPQQQYQAPQQQYQAPQQQYQAPQQQYKSPQQQDKPPQQQIQEPHGQLEPQTQVVEQKQPASNLFLEIEQSSSSKEDDSSEFNPKVLLPSPTRLLNLKQTNENARRSRATGGRSIAGWGRMRTGDSKRLKSILPPRSKAI